MQDFFDIFSPVRLLHWLFAELAFWSCPCVGMETGFGRIGCMGRIVGVSALRYIAPRCPCIPAFGTFQLPIPGVRFSAARFFLAACFCWGVGRCIGHVPYRCSIVPNSPVKSGWSKVDRETLTTYRWSTLPVGFDYQVELGDKISLMFDGRKYWVYCWNNLARTWSENSGCPAIVVCLLFPCSPSPCFRTFSLNFIAIRSCLFFYARHFATNSRTLPGARRRMLHFTFAICQFTRHMIATTDK